MKNLWRNLFLLTSSEVKVAGLSSLILLYFVVRDVATIRLLLTNRQNGGGRSDKSGGKDHHNWETKSG